MTSADRQSAVKTASISTAKAGAEHVKVKKEPELAGALCIQISTEEGV